jgi:hypothetical protein
VVDTQNIRIKSDLVERNDYWTCNRTSEVVRSGFILKSGAADVVRQLDIVSLK